MIVPKYIQKLIKERENIATKFVSLDSELNDWLDKKGIFNKCICGEYSGLFNGGCIELESGSAESTIQYLESIKEIE